MASLSILNPLSSILPPELSGVGVGGKRYL